MGPDSRHFAESAFEHRRKAIAFGAHACMDSVSHRTRSFSLGRARDRVDGLSSLVLLHWFQPERAELIKSPSLQFPALNFFLLRR
jgi:hypothetical protein